MSKFDKYLIRFLIYATPFVATILFWGAVVEPDKASQSPGLEGFLWDSLGILFMLWLLGVLALLLNMVFSKDLRDRVLGSAAGIKERDERESMIVGEAAKVSFLSTLAFITLLMFFSIIQVTVARHKEVTDPAAKRGYVAVGLNLSFFNGEKEEEKKESDDIRYVHYSGVPISSSMLLLLIFIWQVGSYKFVIRKQSLE